MAAFLDTLIEAVLYLVFFLIGVGLLSLTSLFGNHSTWVTAGLILVFFCIRWGYYALFEIFWKGQTPGKRWAGIRVIKDSGRPINAFEAIARNLVRFVDWLPSLYGAGVVAMLLNAKHRRFGDLLAAPLAIHPRSY